MIGLKKKKEKNFLNPLTGFSFGLTLVSPSGNLLARSRGHAYEKNPRLGFCSGH